MLIEVFESEKSRVKWYYLCGYGVPVVIVAISSVVDPFSYGTVAYCWLRADNFFIFSFVGPVIVILLVKTETQHDRRDTKVRSLLPFI